MEKAIVFNINSALGAFQRPQSNNNPSTFCIMPKSALIGIICAVIGVEKEFMKSNNLYKILTEKIRYSVKLKKPFQIKYWSEYGYNHGNLVKPDRPMYTPSKFERLVDVSYSIYVLYEEDDFDIKTMLNNFVENIKNEEFIFPPYMGMANFMAEIKYIGAYDAKPCNGNFETSAICTNIVLDDVQSFEHIRTDDIPTRSESYLAHDLKSFKTIYFNDNCETLKAHGNYHKVENENIEFI